MKLVLEGIARRVGGELHLEDIDLALPPGAITVLLGPTLSGKTSLLRIMAGLDRATEGRVLLDGRFSWDWPLPPLAIEGHTRSPLSFHIPAQVRGSPLLRGGRPAIKFNSFWTIELEGAGRCWPCIPPTASICRSAC
jgi:energy-coupling factor transporter ATP-binding protein EcfA2